MRRNAEEEKNGTNKQRNGKETDGKSWILLIYQRLFVAKKVIEWYNLIEK